MGAAAGMSCAVSWPLADESFIMCFMVPSELRGREAVPCLIVNAIIVFNGDVRGTRDSQGVVGRLDIWSGRGEVCVNI